VEDTRGTPLEGAVVSLFGKGLGHSLVTLSDSAGRFFLPSLPPGLYTLRALGAGHVPAPARQITVLPNQDSVFTLSLIPVEGEAGHSTTAQATDETRRELRWLVRHKRRSVLEDDSAQPPAKDPAPSTADVGLLDLSGSVEVVTTPDSAYEPDGTHHGVGVVRLHGRLTDGATWSLGGLMAEADARTWRMAGEFVIDAGGGHMLRAGTGYGSRYMHAIDGKRVDDEAVGALFLEDSWKIGNRVTATAGGRFSYLGFLTDKSHLDPAASFELHPDATTRLGVSVSTKTLAPGGDLLTLSTLSTSPAVTWASLDPQLRPEHTIRYEVALTEDKGSSFVRANSFYENVDHRLVNAFEHGLAPVLTIGNRAPAAARGMGLTVGRRFGKALATSVTYTFGHTWAVTRPAGLVDDDALSLASPAEGDFQDLSARLEASLDTSTRVVAYYRVNRLSPQHSQATLNRQRFDVQLSQGLPFLNSLLRAQCELLLAMRNLFYEVDEGAMLDEVAVLDPPRRVVGGVSVRF
jgi:TonB dependent receptor/Carboxypeptidase regulatory-like domain